MTPGVLVVIPAHDEEASLPRTLAEVRERAPWAHVLVVDDGSRDDTTGVARAAAVPVVRHAINLGVGAALQTGFRWAWLHGYDIAVQLDADGQHDPGYLEVLVAPVVAGRCDVAIGSRFVSSTGYHAPWNRRLGMQVARLVVRVMLGRPIYDTTSGFRAYARPVIEVCQHDFPKDFPDAPLLIALARRGFRLEEVPVVMRERTAGQSFYTLGKQLYYPYKILLASFIELFRKPV